MMPATTPAIAARATTAAAAATAAGVIVAVPRQRAFQRGAAKSDHRQRGDGRLGEAAAGHILCFVADRARSLFVPSASRPFVSRSGDGLACASCGPLVVVPVIPVVATRAAGAARSTGGHHHAAAGAEGPIVVVPAAATRAAGATRATAGEAPNRRPSRRRHRAPKRRRTRPRRTRRRPAPPRRPSPDCARTCPGVFASRVFVCHGKPSEIACRHPPFRRVGTQRPIRTDTMRAGRATGGTGIGRDPGSDFRPRRYATKVG